MENEKDLKDPEQTGSAQWDEIKRAYREHMKACHPELEQIGEKNVVRVTVENADIDTGVSELKKFVTDDGSFYAIPEKLVEAHLENKRRAENEASQSGSFSVTAGPTIIAEEDPGYRLRQVVKACAAAFSVTLLFVIAFQTGLISSAMARIQSGSQDGADRAVVFYPSGEFVGPKLPVKLTKDRSKAKEAAKIAQKASAPGETPQLKEADLVVGGSGFLSFEEVQRRRSRAQLSFKPVNKPAKHSRR